MVFDNASHAGKVGGNTISITAKCNAHSGALCINVANIATVAIGVRKRAVDVANPVAIAAGQFTLIDMCRTLSKIFDRGCTVSATAVDDQ